ncbi:MFS transporter [Virgibacillus xinjiangensis]|uniref:MFS transporter n=1 Tax=Virgibacillus xinjiangensis TaxID=393090 RepID=A0ABV7CWN5_9BACI
MSHLQKEKLWTRDFVAISMVNFVTMLSMYLLLVTMASYAADTYDAATSMAGLVSSIFILGVLLGRLYGGKEIGKIGSKKMLVIGILFFVTMTLFYLLSISIYVLLLIRFLHGIGVGLATTATGTIAAQVVPDSRKGEGISYFSLSIVLSTAIGPLIGVVLIGYFGYLSIFIFSLVVGIISLLFALPVREPIVEYKEANNGKKGLSLSDFIEPRALPVSIVMLILAVAYSATLSFITTYAAEINLVEAGSMYFFVYGVAILVSRPFTGKLMDVKGGNTVVYPALIIFALGMYLLSQADTSVVFLLAATLIGLGYGNLQSVIQALAIKLTPPHRAGLANSTYFILLDIGIGIGPFFLGFLVPEVGYRGLYLSMVGLIAAGIFVYFLLYGRKESKFTSLETRADS